MPTCTTCGCENRDIARFCTGCGAPVAETRPLDAATEAVAGQAEPEAAPNLEPMAAMPTADIGSDVASPMGTGDESAARTCAHCGATNPPGVQHCIACWEDLTTPANQAATIPDYGAPSASIAPGGGQEAAAAPVPSAAGHDGDNTAPQAAWSRFSAWVTRSIEDGGTQKWKASFVVIGVPLMVIGLAGAAINGVRGNGSSSSGCAASFPGPDGLGGLSTQISDYYPSFTACTDAATWFAGATARGDGDPGSTISGVCGAPVAGYTAPDSVRQSTVCQEWLACVRSVGGALSGIGLLDTLEQCGKDYFS